MNCSETFVMAYNRIFTYLASLGGAEEVEVFWDELSDSVTQDLRKAVKERGLAGAAAYWSNTLEDEGANFIVHLTRNHKRQRLYLLITECPSLRKLKEQGAEPWCGYCHHCTRLYRPIFEEAGYNFNLKKTGSLACRIRIMSQ